ncbi:uncharacterized protein [Antedon mediterranea]|uniref:uncharacterized protein n=1 Tax=Antedon mediterranea TaxID=105859 RepID=UPI003AF64583
MLNILVANMDSNPNGRYTVNNTIQPDRGMATLTIAKTVLSDDGYYVCRINDYYFGEAGSHFGKLNVHYLTGTVTISSTSNDTAIVVTCSGSVDGNPVPNIKLYKDGIIQEQSALPLTYIISSVTENDKGIYMCEVYNTAFLTNSSILELHKPTIETVENDSVEPSVAYVIAPDIQANPQEVTYVWSSDDVNDIDTNPATFTFTSSMVVGTVHNISLKATNLIGSTSKKVRITVSESSKQSEHNKDVSDSKGLVIGMFFVGVFVGAIGLYTYNTIRKKKFAEKQDTVTRKQDRKLPEKQGTENRNQDTYMEYMGDSGTDNQTYQDLQHTVQESAYENVKPGNKYN